MINYSVIIPFRDKYDLVKKAIASIPDRADVQILLVFNGIGGFPTATVPNLQNAKLELLISSGSKGAGHARNVGLRKAIGKYLLFLDSDDFFTDCAFEVFDKYLDSDVDIIFFKSTSIRLKTGELSRRHVDYSKKLDKFLSNGNEDELRFRWEVPWGKMIRRNLAKNNKIEFEEIIVNNDAWFSLMTGYKAKKIIADPAIVYVVTEGEKGESLVKTVTPETIFIRYKVAVRTNKFLKSINKKHMRIRLLGYIYLALKTWGPKEAFKLFCYASSQETSIF